MKRASDASLTLVEVAERLGLHYQTVYKRVVYHHEIPVMKIGRVYRVKERDLVAFEKAHVVQLGGQR